MKITFSRLTICNFFIPRWLQLYHLQINQDELPDLATTRKAAVNLDSTFGLQISRIDKDFCYFYFIDSPTRNTELWILPSCSYSPISGTIGCITLTENLSIGDVTVIAIWNRYTYASVARNSIFMSIFVNCRSFPHPFIAHRDIN